MEFLWLGLAAVFAAVEGVTVQVVSVWFAIGSVGGMIAALCGAFCDNADTYSGCGIGYNSFAFQTFYSEGIEA